MTIYQKYHAQLNRDFDWSAIKEYCQENPEEDSESDSMVGFYYIGSVFSLCPSGKYYMPWACSNVDPCPICKGSGNSKRVWRTIDGKQYFESCHVCGGLGSLEAYQDQEFYRALETIAEKHGLYIQSGEGDPCDIFACLWISDLESE